MVSVSIMVGKTVTMKMTIRVRMVAGDDDDDDNDIGEGDDKDNREPKQLLLRRRRRQQQLQKTIGLMIKTARASLFSVQFFDVQFRSKKAQSKGYSSPW